MSANINYKSGRWVTMFDQGLPETKESSHIILKIIFMKIKTASLIQSTFLLLSSLIFLGTYGQTKRTSVEKISLHVAGGPSSHKGSFSEFGVQAVLKHNWTSTFSYHSIEMNPKNLPANYDPGYTVVFFIPLRNADPTIQMK